MLPSVCVSIKPAITKITIMANPMKDGRPAGALLTATKADGSVFSPRPSGQAGAGQKKT